MRMNHGITLIELVLVMIVMILLVSFAVYSGIESIEKAEATELYEEMSTMMNAVGGVITQKIIGDYDDEWLKNYYDKAENDDWYTIYGIDEAEYASSNVRKNLEMEAIRRTYLVNYETGEVMLEKPVEILGVSVRTYESVRNLVESDKI